MSNFCYTNKIICEDATSNGYCSLTACRNIRLCGNTIMSEDISPVGEIKADWGNIKLNHWKTGKPIENDWYLTETISKDTPYEVLKFENGKWFDYLDGVFEEVRDSYVKKWKKIED